MFSRLYSLRSFALFVAISLACVLCASCTGFNPFRVDAESTAETRASHETLAALKEVSMALREFSATSNTPLLRPPDKQDDATVTTPAPQVVIVPAPVATPDAGVPPELAKIADTMGDVADKLDKVLAAGQSAQQAQPQNPLAGVGAATQAAAPMFGPAAPWVYLGGSIAGIIGAWLARGKVWTPGDVQAAKTDLNMVAKVS